MAKDRGKTMASFGNLSGKKSQIQRLLKNILNSIKDRENKLQFSAFCRGKNIVNFVKRRQKKLLILSNNQEKKMQFHQLVAYRRMRIKSNNHSKNQKLKHRTKKSKISQENLKI